MDLTVEADVVESLGDNNDDDELTSFYSQFAEDVLENYDDISEDMTAYDAGRIRGIAEVASALTNADTNLVADTVIPKTILEDE